MQILLLRLEHGAHAADPEAAQQPERAEPFGEVAQGVRLEGTEQAHPAAAFEPAFEHRPMRGVPVEERSQRGWARIVGRQRLRQQVLDVGAFGHPRHHNEARPLRQRVPQRRLDARREVACVLPRRGFLRERDPFATSARYGLAPRRSSMRILPALVVVQTVLLVVLVALWSQRASATAPPATGPTSASREPAEAGAVTGSLEALAQAPASERQRATTRAPAPAATANLVLQGRFLGVDPPPHPDNVRLTMRRTGQYCSGSASAVGSYAIASLTPGVWQLQCTIPGYRRLDVTHTLDDAPVQRLDLQFEKAQTLTVWATTTDGKRLAHVLGHRISGLHVTAAPQPFVGDFEPSAHGSLGDFGIGRYRKKEDLNPKADPTEPDGTLELDAAPPAYAALLLRHQVLAQQAIEPGQTELRFVVDLAGVLARFPMLRVRVLGPDGKPAEARVSVNNAMGMMSGRPTEADGTIVLEQVQPGMGTVQINTKDGEHWESRVTIQPGIDVDLGDVTLTERAELRGRAVDQHGAPVAVSVEWTALDTWRPPHPLLDNRSTQSDGDGAFQLWNAGRRRYTVLARTGEDHVGFAIVDGTIATAEPFRITVHPTRRLHVDGTAAGARCVVIADQQGRPLAVRRCERAWPQQTFPLPDGEYQFVVYDGNGVERHRERLVVAGLDLTKVLP